MRIASVAGCQVPSFNVRRDMLEKLKAQLQTLKAELRILEMSKIFTYICSVMQVILTRKV